MFHDMLPPDHRLRKTKEIERVWKRGRSFFGPMLQVKAFPNGGAVTRFAVVVGTAASKRAVRRNLVKRRVREILRSHLAEVPPGYDVIVSAKKPAIGASYAALESALLAALAGLTRRA